MRIVLDMQGAQTESRNRGIGRYTISFAKAVVRNRGEHEIILALNGLFPGSVESIRYEFKALLPVENIVVWTAPGPVRLKDTANEQRSKVAELMREGFLANLQPDLIHICSLFEGYMDDAVVSINRLSSNIPVSVTLYDLIPLMNEDKYLRPVPSYSCFYHRKYHDVGHAAICLAISTSARNEGLQFLPQTKDQIINVSAGIEPTFGAPRLEGEKREGFLRKYQINKKFILYTGGADERKNLRRLIQAYASLPLVHRRSLQLVFAGEFPKGNIAELEKVASDAGLIKTDIHFTGYVSDEELILLYSLCYIFIFPSWHEGFGLPALEAMTCGAPVIAANTSSLPEVIGNENALFDPFDISSISTKILQVLEDNDFRQSLKDHGKERAKLFSWDRTALDAIGAWEQLSDRPALDYLTRSNSGKNLLDRIALEIEKFDEESLKDISTHLALNQQASVERQLFLDVSEISQRDSATGVQRVVKGYLNQLLTHPPKGFRVEPVFATQDQGYRYARSFTARFLGLNVEVTNDSPIRWQRGDVFFGLDMQHHVQLAHAETYRNMRSQGVTIKFQVYDLLPIELEVHFKDSDARELHEKWLEMITSLDGAICISKSTATALGNWITECNIQIASNFQNTGILLGTDAEKLIGSRGIPKEAPRVLEILDEGVSFLCVGTLEPRKRQKQILDAVQLLWENGREVNLVFVGQLGWKVDELAQRIGRHEELNKRLFWLQGISDEYLNRIYENCDCLITASINEGFGLPIIEAAQHNTPIIARDIPVFREVAGNGAFYFRGDEAADLATSLDLWLTAYEQQTHPDPVNVEWQTWGESAEKLKHALIKSGCPKKQLFLDISELVQRDAKTGIQRVVKSLLEEIYLNPPDSFQVVPVYASLNEGYKYANRFICKFFGDPDYECDVADEFIDYGPGDFFFVLDLKPDVQISLSDYYLNLRRFGVIVKFLVHDLLPLEMPQYFDLGTSEIFEDWLSVAAQSDGAVCVSKSTAQALTRWVSENCKKKSPEFQIAWSHNGVNLPPGNLKDGRQGRSLETIELNESGISFLMVGTLEPRKGHAQVLAAFSDLWSDGIDVQLFIVGKSGWLCDELSQSIAKHPELRRRLFWLDSIDDDTLNELYLNCTCLIAASYGEGFGLPLIEAAQKKLPIIARDIQVFREVAGDHAFYFEGDSSKDLESVIKSWLKLHETGSHPRSDSMPYFTWAESAENLLRRLGVYKNRVNKKAKISTEIYEAY